MYTLNFASSTVLLTELDNEATFVESFFVILDLSTTQLIVRYLFSMSSVTVLTQYPRNEEAYDAFQCKCDK